MYAKKELRRLYEARIEETPTELSARQRHVMGAARFVDDVHVMLGIKKQTGEGRNARFTESRDDMGQPVFQPNRAKPEEFSLRHLAEAIGGEEWVENYFNPEGAKGSTQDLLEAGPGIDPTAALNINVFSLAVAGLYQAAVMEGYEEPGYIGDQLVTVKPTRMNGEKMIKQSKIGDKGTTRHPNQPHARAGFDEEWIRTPELVEKALACDLTQEMVFYDITGQVLERGRSIGEELGYLKEKAQIDLALGVTNNYNYKDTAYNTYQTAAPWINSHTNLLVDHTDLQNCRALFRKMTDPATGKEILVVPTTLIHHSDREDDFYRVFNQTQQFTGTNGTTDVGFGTLTVSPPPPSVSVNKPKLLSSPILDNRLTAADGLNLSLSNAQARWYWGNPTKAFWWMQAWDIRVQQAAATEYVMIDRGLVASFFSNFRAVGAVIEPRQMVVNTH